MGTLHRFPNTASFSGVGYSAGPDASAEKREAFERYREQLVEEREREIWSDGDALFLAITEAMIDCDDARLSLKTCKHIAAVAPSLRAHPAHLDSDLRAAVRGVITAFEHAVRAKAEAHIDWLMDDVDPPEPAA